MAAKYIHLNESNRESPNCSSNFDAEVRLNRFERSSREVEEWPVSSYLAWRLLLFADIAGLIVIRDNYSGGECC